MQDAGERESGASMIHIEIINVKPQPDLAASDIVLKATVLPLRLHVDQDALDFITRFFEFKDNSAPVEVSSGDPPFLQRVEVNSIQVKLDFKPKRVDYAGLRSGHTTEFMNFFILDEADMVLRHTIIYGIRGFDKLGKCLNDIWMPDIKRNQLPGILAGLAPVRSLVNVGGGLRHLVVVPMREYKKDGRIVRGISKGAAAFVRTTGTELVKLGAKVAIGVQTVLQGAEDFLGPTSENANVSIEGDDVEEENRQISLYANQPVGVLQGLKGGYAGLQRDLVLARDAIIAVPGEVMEGGNAAGVLRAVRKHAPTVILRPAIGLVKASGQVLMGATNSLDPNNLQRVDNVSAK
jgi:autophagy-related protein 2